MRVLLVEDDARLAEVVTRGLRADGFAVDVARDGAQGLWQATEHEYDVVILDIMLPVLSGYEVVRRLRERDVHTPVLVLTAKDGEYDEADALDLGADDYLTKPFFYVVLLARLRALMRRGGARRPPVLVTGDLQFDPATRRCQRDGEPVELTAREAGVLEYLMERHDQVVSKSELLAHVWDQHYDGDPNVVEVYVSYLRKKLDSPTTGGVIETVRGAGYRLRGRAP
ncbi:response regulator transcription factor [Actinocrinis puniceicyclus]|uniref:Response regulator transcription factor n=1 Tax=Actinocrinis puniceicyclus TaxID=977794 RepID=A0A8J8BFD8_9ACTN|nr:response regulator transcription factor [Actinocrinis puniceicyclus]MBS2966550.1 response regulator transcription factor [Actinocrinis puniceicyclus]